MKLPERYILLTIWLHRRFVVVEILIHIFVFEESKLTNVFSRLERSERDVGLLLTKNLIKSCFYYYANNINVKICLSVHQPRWKYRTDFDEIWYTRGYEQTLMIREASRVINMPFQNITCIFGHCYLIIKIPNWQPIHLLIPSDYNSLNITLDKNQDYPHRVSHPLWILWAPNRSSSLCREYFNNKYL